MKQNSSDIDSRVAFRLSQIFNWYGSADKVCLGLPTRLWVKPQNGWLRIGSQKDSRSWMIYPFDILLLFV